jgi:type II secretory pathway component HofQ/Flp pilus assembly protein TadD
MMISGRTILALTLAALPFAWCPEALAQDGGKLDKDKGAGTVKEQERAFLGDSYFKVGKQLFDEMRYREAAAQLRLAVKADPNHAEARKLLDQTLFILGDSAGAYRDEARRFIDERQVKIGQASMEVERLFAEGLRFMEKQDYPAAIERFERVVETIRWFPYNIDKSGLKAQAEEKMAEARTKETEREALFKEQQQTAAREQSAIEEQRQSSYHQARIRQLFEQAMAAFERTDYAKAERLCQTLIRQEPSHDHARKLLDRARHARRFKDEVYTIENGIEEMKRLIEGVYEAAIPYQAIFSFPGDDEWAAVQKRAVELQEAFERKGAAESPEEQRIRMTLTGRRVTINFPGTSFDDAVNFLRDITGLNYVVAAPAVEALAAEPVTINLRLRDIILKNALELILSQSKDLVYKIKHDAIYINTKDAEKEDLYLRFYEVSEIVNDLPDYPAPKLALADTQASQGGQGGAGGAILSIGDEGEQPKTGVSADKLKELIEQKIGDEGEGSVEYMGGLLMVRKSLNAHRKIEKLLESLRRTTGIMVTVETRIIDIQDNFLEEIGVDFRGLPAVISNLFGLQGREEIGYNWTNKDRDVDVRSLTFNKFSQVLGSAAATPFNLTNVGGSAFQYNVLDDFQLQAIIDAVKKKQKAKQVDAPRVTVFNSQRSHMLAIKQDGYIADIEVNQTGVTPTINPVIGVLNSGSILEARPIVSHDRKFVTLEIQPTLAIHVDSVKQRLILNPGTGNTDITIELPVVSLNEIRSTVMVPDGGTVILGGLKNFLEQENWSGVPVVGRVPVLRNLFERKGWSDFKRSLIVLLKCDITIVREEEARRFNKQAPVSPSIK